MPGCLSRIAFESTSNPPRRYPPRSLECPTTSSPKHLPPKSRPAAIAPSTGRNGKSTASRVRSEFRKNDGNHRDTETQRKAALKIFLMRLFSVPLCLCGYHL